MNTNNDYQLIKDQLIKTLYEITIPLSKTLSLVRACSGHNIEIRNNYPIEEFGFSTGQFVKETCPCGSHFRIMLCVGVGKGCPDNPDEEELWFLFQDDAGIRHICGGRMEKFLSLNMVVIP